MPENSEFIEKFAQVVYKKFAEILGKCMYEMHKAKLGLPEADENTVSELWNPLRELLKGIDFTIFWRQLAAYSAEPNRQWTSETILQPLLPVSSLSSSVFFSLSLLRVASFLFLLSVFFLFFLFLDQKSMSRRFTQSLSRLHKRMYTDRNINVIERYARKGKKTSTNGV